MHRNSFFQGVFLSLVAMGFVLTSTAGAGVISVSPLGVRDVLQVGYGWYADESGFRFEFNTEAMYTQAYVPLNLPSGAVIKKFTVVFTSPGASPRYGLSVGLVRINILTGESQLIARVDTVNRVCDHTPVQTTQISHKTVNNSLYTYYLSLYEEDPAGQQIFHGALIYY